MQQFCTCENSPASKIWLMWSESSRSVGAKKREGVGRIGERHGKMVQSPWKKMSLKVMFNSVQDSERHYTTSGAEVHNLSRLI